MEETLDDLLLFILRLIERQSYLEKLRVFDTVSGEQNILIEGSQVLFLSRPPDSNEAKCKLRLEISNIYGTLSIEGFIFFADHHAILYILNLEEHKLYYWNPEKDSMWRALMLWELKTRIGTLWLKLLRKIKKVLCRN